MKRLTDKQLFDAIEARVGNGSTACVLASDLIAYAHLRALERLADNVNIFSDVLAVIRNDHVPSRAGNAVGPLPELWTSRPEKESEACG